MEYRKLGNIKENISALGFGLMRLPRKFKDSQEIDYEQAEQMIDLAIKNGVNYFDTAWPYHEGLSEKFVGDVLSKYPRESYNIASKCPIWSIKKKEDVLDIFNKQLEKCNVEYFDFYLMHALNRNALITIEKFEIYDILNNLKKQGKIRYLGFSFHDTPSVLQQIVDTFEFDFGQIQLNYIDWEEYQSEQQYNILRNKKLPIIIMEPVRGGTLATLSPSACDVFYAHDESKSIASWAIRFVESLDGILTVLSGMSTMLQVEDNLETLNNFVPLNANDLSAIEVAKKAYRTADTILCTNCRYCLPCPHGVNIPKNFSIYNQYRLDNNVELLVKSYNELPKEEKSNNCKRCLACLKKCPQSLEIVKLLGKITNTLDNLAK